MSSPSSSFPPSPPLPSGAVPSESRSSHPPTHPNAERWKHAINPQNINTINTLELDEKKAESKIVCGHVVKDYADCMGVYVMQGVVKCREKNLAMENCLKEFMIFGVVPELMKEKKSSWGNNNNNNSNSSSNNNNNNSGKGWGW